MKKVKIFNDYNPLRLETQINEWVEFSHQRGQKKIRIQTVGLSTVGHPSPMNPLPDTHYYQLFATVVYRQGK